MFASWRITSTGKTSRENIERYRRMQVPQGQDSVGRIKPFDSRERRLEVASRSRSTSVVLLQRMPWWLLLSNEENL